MKDNFLYLREQIISFKEFKEALVATERLFESHSTILIKSESLPILYASILAARALNISLYVCPNSLSDAQVKDLAIKWKGSYFLDGKALESTDVERKTKIPGLGVFTSGTTGEPKIVLHRWEAIESSSYFVPPKLHGQTWMLSYSPWSYAGLQVFFSAWNNHGSIYYRAEQFKDVCQDMVDYGVTVVSATPTFWKMLIGAWPQGLEVPSLLQATLGGEIVDQSVIDMINVFFHPRQLTHIYASTEAGTAIVVSDNLAGFPVSILEKPGKSGVKLRIIDDELQVLSPVGMEAYADETNSKSEEWIKTGDLVQIKEGRVYFLGRTDGRINIGGRKVCPEEVEQALNSLEEVEDCLVYEKKSPIVGSLIAADVVIKGSEQFNPMEIKQKLKNLLEEYKLPHIIRRVDHFAISSTGKKIRKIS